jgi:5'-nucleotidase
MIGWGCPGADAPTPRPADRRVTILATNDFHGAFHEERLDAETAVGGAVALAATIGRVRKAVGPENMLLLDGGDLFQGTALVNATEGLASVELFGRLGYDAVAVGNHEFDYRGPPNDLRAPLKAAAAAAKFPFLTGNTFLAGSDQRFAAPGIQATTMLVRGGIKIGIMGLTTTTTATSTHPKNVVGLTFAPVHVVAEELSAELRAAGAEVVIAVAHVTGSCESPRTRGVPDAPSCTLKPSELKQLTALPPGTLDVIVAGHQNQWIHQAYGSTFVMEQLHSGRAVGRLDLVVGPDGVRVDRSTIHAPIEVKHSPREPTCGDPTPISDYGPLDEWLAGREAGLSLERCDRIGCLRRAADRSRETQSAAGTLVATALLDAWDADVALQNAGGLRIDLAEGPVYAPDLFRFLPFENTVVRMEMSGARLRNILRLGTSGEGEPIQVAGISYGWDSERKGDRLCWVRVGDEPLYVQRRYRVLMNDYMAAGGLDIPGIADFPREEGPRLRDVVGDALRVAGDACVDPGVPSPSQTAFRTSCP